MLRNYKQYYFLIAAIAFAIYANSLSNEFVFDDESVVVGDQSLTKLSNIPKYFTAQEGFHKIIGRYYRPVVSTTYNLDYAVWGLNSGGFHFTNVLIHVINSILVLQILLMIFYGSKDERKNKFRLIGVIIGAIIFAVHPIHTEAVSWVSGRTDSISFTFFALAFIYYLKYDIKDSNKNLFFICLYFFISLLAKEMAITFPAVIILYDIIVKNKRSIESLKPRFKLYIVLIVLSLAYLIIRWLILKDVPQRESYFYFFGKDAATSVFTMLQTLPLYFRLTFVPVKLLYHYNGYLPFVNSLGNFQVMFAVFFTLIMLALAFYLLKRMPLISFCIVFFFVTLLPVMNIIPTMNYMAERFLYIPSIIVSIALVYLFIKFYSEKNKTIIYGLSVIVILFYSYQTFTRNAEWKDNNTLFLSAAGKPGSVTLVNIGNIYANNKQFDEAEKFYRDALTIRRENVLANVNIGKIFMTKNNFDSAFVYMDYARTLDTLSPEPLHALGMLAANFGRFDDAIKYLEKIQTLVPNYMNSAELLEQVKLQRVQKPNIKGNTNEVGADEQTFNLEKKSFELYQQKRYDEAVEVLKELIKRNPAGASGYYNNMGMCYLDRNMLAEAEQQYKKAIEADDKFIAAYNNLGKVEEMKGNPKKASEYYRKAIEIDPNNQPANEGYGRTKGL